MNTAQRDNGSAGTVRGLVHTVLAAVIAGAASTAGAKAEWTAPTTAAATSCLIDPTSGAWWAGFNDAALNLLHAMAANRSSGSSGSSSSSSSAAAARGDACAPAALTAAYVQLRVLGLRLAVLQSMLVTTGRQTALLGGGGEAQSQNQTDSARDVLAQRGGKAVAMLGQLVDNRRSEFELTRQRQQMGQASAVFHAMQHLCRRVFAPAAALQILAIPLGIAAVGALLRGQIHDCISAAQHETLH